ncbi:MAG: hypothetical protein QOD61_697, partial [Solirubrobacteraceae bacterium]|nr:hypothetical protein [Solirubrobacteraceae bacterium]
GASLGATGRPLPIPPPAATTPAQAKLRPLAVPRKPARPRGLQGAGAKSPRAHPVPARSGSHPAHPAPAKGPSGPTPGPKTRIR